MSKAPGKWHGFAIRFKAKAILDQRIKNLCHLK